MVRRGDGGVVGRDPGCQPGALIGRKPGGVVGPIRQESQKGEGQDHRRRALGDQQPLPAVQARSPVEAEQAARHRAHHHRGQGRGDIEPRDRPAAVGLREPEAEVVDHPGEEAGLRRAQQEAHEVELPGRLDQRHAHGDEAPGDHDPRQPAPRADPGQRQVGGDFQQGVADEEQAAAEAVDRGGEAQLGVHGRRGEADVHPVHVRDEVAQQDQRQQAPGDRPDRAPLQRLVRHARWSRLSRGRVVHDSEPRSRGRGARDDAHETRARV